VSERASGVRFCVLDVRLLLIGQKRKLVKPVNRAKRRDFISNLQGKQGWNKEKLNYFRVYSYMNNLKVKSNKVKQHFKLNHLRPNQ